MTGAEGLTPSLQYNILTYDTTRRAEVVQEEFHITDVYGWHLTEEHATELLETIEPDSVVFVEGHMRDPEYTSIRLRRHVSLVEQRLEHGDYSSLSEACEALTSEFLHRQFSPATEHDMHSYVLYKGLLDKGCLILPADYLNFGEGTPQLHNLDDTRNKLRALFPITSNAELEQAIRLDSDLLDLDLDNLAMREMFAVNLILYFLSQYHNRLSQSNVSREQDGRLRVYVIFGLAHRDSLAGRFESLGIQTDHLFINTSDEPLSGLRNIAEQTTLTSEERRLIIRNYYLGQMAIVITG